MSINKFIHNLDDTPLHSSGYAEAAQSGQMGAVSAQSFNQRLHVDRNRQAVRRYHDSMIATGHYHTQRQQGNAVRQPVTGGAGVQRPAGRLIADVARPAARQRFTEPPTRGYNPYK